MTQTTTQALRPNLSGNAQATSIGVSAFNTNNVNWAASPLAGSKALEYAIKYYYLNPKSKVL